MFWNACRATEFSLRLEECVMYAFEYTLDEQGRRVLRGLDFEETTEFELLEAARPMDRRPDGSLPQDTRWLQLFNKYEQARAAKAAA